MKKQHLERKSLLRFVSIAMGFVLFSITLFVLLHRRPSEDTVSQEKCIHSVGGFVGILNDCQELSQCRPYEPLGPLGPVEDCFFGVAVKKREPKICRRIKTPWKENGCLSNIAQQLQDESICNQMNQKEDFWWEHRDLCANSIRRDAQNPSTDIAVPTARLQE